MRRAVRYLALAPVVVCAACGGSGAAKVTQSISGGTKAERSLAREVLQKLEPSPVTSVVFRGVQHDAIHHWPGRRMDVIGPGDTIDQQWQEDLFGLSYVVVARQRHVSVGFVTTNGGGGLLQDELRDAPGKTIDGSALQRYEQKLRAAARAGHVGMALRELRPGPVALAVTVSTRTPASFIKHHLGRIFELVVHRPGGIFGELLTIRGLDSTALIQFGSLPDEGMSSILPSVSGCTHLLDHPTIRNTPVPHCPV